MYYYLRYAKASDTASISKIAWNDSIIFAYQYALVKNGNFLKRLIGTHFTAHVTNAYNFSIVQIFQLNLKNCEVDW